jgi:hypothetical protein
MEGDPFFSLPPNPEWNAFIGIQAEAIFYAEGYIEAALELATLIIKENRFLQKDTLVMPILYNARHSIELHLKLFIDAFVKVGLISSGHRSNHDIGSQYTLLMKANIGDSKVRSLLEALEPFVLSLNQIDNDGQELRYLENRNGKRSLHDKALANILVIQKSLVNLKTILSTLYFRTLSLCDEQRTGTRTTQLSRADLFEIASLIPPRSEWSDPRFDHDRKVTMERFGIGRGQFSKALNKIQKTRELKAILRIETPLVHLSDAKAVFLAEQWKIIHPPRQTAELGFDITKPNDFETLFKNEDHEKAARKKVEERLTSDEIADAKTIFYLARETMYSECYETFLERTKKNLRERNDVPQEIYDLIQKTNFLVMLEAGVRKLGRLQLAEQLGQMRATQPKTTTTDVI